MKKFTTLIISMLLLAVVSEAQWSFSGNNIYNTNSGNVGIGNSIPGSLLTVGKTTTEPTISVRNFGGAGGASYSMIDDISGANWKFKATNTGGFKIRDHAYGLDVFTIEANSSANALYINSAGNIGMGTSIPAARLDIIGGNNWDLVNGEGDLRLGNSLYRIKMGIALAGGGAGAAGIMQYGQPGGYNVLKLGAQGNYLLFINGESQKVGIGTDNPQAALDVSSTTQGFLPPRLTQVQIEALTPVAGLLVFNTTTLKPNYYDGSQWRNFDGSFAIKIGEGYHGGILAYILESGDPGYDPNVVHGLIASPSNLSADWGCNGTDIPGAGGTAIGTGNQNTIDIVAVCTTDGIAAKLCSDLTLNGYSDWYLPSLGELNMLYLNRTAIGGFFTSDYWSSSETNSTIALCKSFNSGGGVYNLEKYNTFYVRAIRAF